MIKHCLVIQLFLVAITGNAQVTKQHSATPRFAKQVITTQFVSEGSATADVNKDGKIDIIAGAFWFEAPSWKRHEITRGDTFNIKAYSNTFLNFAIDVNQDGWIDY